jgi:predicted AAA+ superfamily ATPase
LEVDFILADGLAAIEVKSSKSVDNRALNALDQFRTEQKPKHCLVVTNEPIKRIVNQITLIPWQEFLKELWAGTYV